MKIEIRVTPVFYVTFTEPLLISLISMSAHHYDSTCRSYSFAGTGELQRALTALKFDRDNGYEINARGLSFRDLDIISKICEIAILLKPEDLKAVSDLQMSISKAIGASIELTKRSALVN